MCLALGIPSLRELHERLTPADLCLWYALHQLQPWGEHAADVRTAIHGAQLARAAGAEADVSHFLPKWDQGDERQRKERERVQREAARIQLRAWVREHNKHATTPGR